MCQYKYILKNEYIITNELRKILREPLGLLVSDDRVTYEEIVRQINKDAMIVTVGDATTERMISLGFIPSIQIVDGKEMRIERILPISTIKTELRASNPAGHITRDSIIVLSSARNAEKPVRIIVDGEEDLLVLPVLALFPNHTSIFYGQPEKGIVVVKVNQRSREMAISLMERMITRMS